LRLLDGRVTLIVLTGRLTDDWLARWSRADAAVSHPVDPAALTAAVAGVLRTRLQAKLVRVR
jgi:DNA-binding response OmpR family regulator